MRHQRLFSIVDFKSMTKNIFLTNCHEFLNSPSIYIKPDGDIKKSFNGKIKVSVRKLLKIFDQGSGLLMRVVELTGNKNLKSAWLILLPDRNSWYTIQRIYWQKTFEKSKESPVNNNLNDRSNQHDGFSLKN